jgi:hypothetical protein
MDPTVGIQTVVPGFVLFSDGRSDGESPRSRHEDCDAMIRKPLPYYVTVGNETSSRLSWSRQIILLPCLTRRRPCDSALIATLRQLLERSDAAHKVPATIKVFHILVFFPRSALTSTQTHSGSSGAVDVFTASKTYRGVALTGRKLDVDTEQDVQLNTKYIR